MPWHGMAWQGLLAVALREPGVRMESAHACAPVAWPANSQPHGEAYNASPHSRRPRAATDGRPRWFCRWVRSMSSEHATSHDAASEARPAHKLGCSWPHIHMYLGWRSARSKCKETRCHASQGGCLALRGSTVVAGTLAPMHGLAMIAYVYKCMY